MQCLANFNDQNEVSTPREAQTLDRLMTEILGKCNNVPDNTTKENANSLRMCGKGDGFQISLKIQNLPDIVQ